MEHNKREMIEMEPICSSMAAAVTRTTANVGDERSRKLLQFPCLIKVTLAFVFGETESVQYLTGTP